MHAVRLLSTCLISAGIMIQVGGCLDGGTQPETLPTEGVVARAAQSLIIAGFDAEICPGTYMVGTVSLHQDCPPGSADWVREQLFPGSTGELARYCAYRWNGISEAPKAGDFTSLPHNGTVPGLGWLDPDCMIVAANSGPDPYETVKGNLHDAYMTQVAAPSTLPAPLSPVRIGVVDSRPEVAPGSPADQLGHGLGMITLMQNILCDPISGPCPFMFKPELALNLETRFEPNQQKGGFFGSQVRLARQIYQSVTSWQAQGSGGPPLVMHLALGWNPELSRDDYNNMSEAVLGVRRSIEHATCSGALVIAAAGNASGPLGANGPLHPAAWEQDATTCNGGVSRPLLYSVGGVDNEDKPLYNTRPGGRPKLAAPGFFATPDHPSRELGPFTGSSPAVAVATAAAALIWADDPTLSPATVMDRVYQYGVELDEVADYCYGPSCGYIHRISICDVAKALVSPQAFQCTTLGKYDGENPTLTTAELDHLAELVPADQLFGGACDAPQTTSACSDITRLAGDPPQDLWLECPADHIPEAIAVPAIAPQDTIPACAVCSGEVSFPGSLAALTLSLHLKTSLRSRVYPATLTLFNAAGDQVDSVSLANATTTDGRRLSAGLDPGASALVELSNLPSGDIATGSIVFTSDGTSPRTVQGDPVVIQYGP